MGWQLNRNQYPAKMKNLLIVSLILFFSYNSNCQDKAEAKKVMNDFRMTEMKSWNEFRLNEEKYRGDNSIDILFYHLDIEIAIDSAYISGDVLCRFTPLINDLDEIFLDLNDALAVTNISAPCDSFYQENNQIFIQLEESYNPGELIDLYISYEGKPRLAGGYKGLRYETHGNNEPVIATLSTPFLAHYWYPCKDGPEDKADSVYVDISIDNKMVNGIEMMAVSNGILEKTSIEGSKKKFSWRHRYPIVTYYVMAAISNYVHFEDEYQSESGDILPLDYYVFNEKLQAQQQGVENLPQVMGFFGDHYGNYPFSNEKYGMTQLGYYGAIENQTNTITNNMETNWFMVSVHELAHMWFGDMITCETWNHAWINEGFATYSEALWVENIEGEVAYHAYLEDLKYFGGGSIYLDNPLDTFNVFSPIIYYKGAWALHMIRHIIGDSTFFEAVNNYAVDTNFMYKTATTEDLQGVFESISGTDLNFFFAQWIYDEFYPTYHYNYIQESNSLFITLYQAQEELYGRRPVFEMPVDIKVVFSDNTDTTLTIRNDVQLQYFEFEFEKEVSNLVIDPDEWILGKAYYKVDLPVSVDVINDSKQIKLYPNPVKNKLLFEVLNPGLFPFEITLYDMKGSQLLRHIIKNNRAEINTEKLNSGVYLYSILNTASKKPITGKIIKE